MFEVCSVYHELYFPHAISSTMNTLHCAYRTFPCSLYFSEIRVFVMFKKIFHNFVYECTLHFKHGSLLILKDSRVENPVV